MLQVEPPEGCEPLIEPGPAIPEWIFVLRAGLSRHRAALFVAAVAVVAAVVILVIP